MLFACSEDGGARVDAELRATDGPFAGMLMIEPNPPKVGDHRVIITLDAADEAVEGAHVVVTPWMPVHGHGTTDVVAEEIAPGVYEAEKVFFNMPGLWDLHVHVEAEHDARGELTASFDVP
jgi:hypothetical protein